MKQGFVVAGSLWFTVAVLACGGSAQTGPGDDGGAGSAGAQPSPGAGSGNAGAGNSSSAGSGNTGSAGAAGKGADCEVGKITYASGTSWKCDCNTCFCMDGRVGSTAVACFACTYEGNNRYAGESFRSADGCNTCTCESDGSVACTDKACTCDPDKEWNRKYVSTPEGCQLIDFACTGNTKGFGNSCGCGCEQDASCPQYINCIPGAADCSAMTEKCPLSIIVQ